MDILQPHTNLAVFLNFSKNTKRKLTLPATRVWGNLSSTTHCLSAIRLDTNDRVSRRRIVAHSSPSEVSHRRTDFFRPSPTSHSWWTARDRHSWPISSITHRIFSADVVNNRHKKSRGKYSEMLNFFKTIIYISHTWIAPLSDPWKLVGRE